MAFYQFLAIFPALLMIHIVAAHIPDLSPGVRQSFADAASKILPRDVAETLRLIAEDFSKVQLRGWRFLTTLAGVLWAGCNGTWAIIYGLNAAYGHCQVSAHSPSRRSIMTGPRETNMALT
jgi:uncharacterized BrkB/YihY/UPF0761 family membrane protein